MKKKKNGQILPEDTVINLSDFALFLSVMKNRDAYESTLSIILEEPDLELKEVKVEQVVLNRSGKTDQVQGSAVHNYYFYYAGGHLRAQ